MRRVAVLVCLLACTEEPPEMCKQHVTEVCIACGNGSQACVRLRERVRLGLHDKSLTDENCRAGFEQHHATVAAIGGASKWCDAENKKQ